jgi:glutathione S-transferase
MHCIKYQYILITNACAISFKDFYDAGTLPDALSDTLTLPPTSPVLVVVPPLLYSFRRCPYAIRARMALRYAGVPVDVHEVALREKPAALLAVSPKATVPVLITPEGTVIDQSLDIMQWALHQSDPDGWLTGSTPAAQHWVTLNDDIFKPLLDRYKYAGRYPELSATAHRSRALAALVQPLDAQLQKTQWLLGPHVSWADVALFPFVRQFAGVDNAWFSAQPLPAVQAWLGTWLASSLFNDVIAKS